MHGGVVDGVTWHRPGPLAADVASADEPQILAR
jgi:hypothetical protein